MDKSVKAFILASLVYLFLGACFGTMMTMNIGQPVLFRFAHMHLLLLGFMAMMVYGVGYFILPRFNGTELNWPWMVQVHFWISNLGLLGLCFADLNFRPVFALISLLGVGLFSLNLIVTLVKAPSVSERLARQAHSPEQSAAVPTAPSPAVAAAPDGITITGHETIGELLSAHPQLDPVIRTFFGDGCFSCPGQATESVIQAAQMHNIEPELLIEKLKEAIKQG
jgi:hypothetical protein